MDKVIKGKKIIIRVAIIYLAFQALDIILSLINNTYSSGTLRIFVILRVAAECFLFDFLYRGRAWAKILIIANFAFKIFLSFGRMTIAMIPMLITVFQQGIFNPGMFPPIMRMAYLYQLIYCVLMAVCIFMLMSKCVNVYQKYMRTGEIDDTGEIDITQ
jgi:hypothetical protein